jgi:hypothetical protein
METEIATTTPREIDERARKGAEAFRRFIAQDYALITEAMLNGHIDRLVDSVRVVATGQTDAADGSPIFLAVGSASTPEATIGVMCGRPSTIRYRQVDVPAESGKRPLPSPTAPVALPSIPEDLPKSPFVEPARPQGTSGFPTTDRITSRAETAQEET